MDDEVEKCFPSNINIVSSSLLNTDFVYSDDAIKINSDSAGLGVDVAAYRFSFNAGVKTKKVTTLPVGNMFSMYYNNIPESTSKKTICAVINPNKGS